MAIINTTDNSYHRVDIKNSYATSNGIHVVVYVYESKAEREKEKSRHDNIKKFLDNVKNKLVEIGDEFDKQQNKQSKEEGEITDINVDQDTVDKMDLLNNIIWTTDPSVRAQYVKSEYTNNLFDDDTVLMFSKISEELYVPDMFVEPQLCHIYEKNIDFLKKLGYDPKWLSDPVVIWTIQCKYCSKEAENISMNYDTLYAKLKENFDANMDPEVFYQGISSEFILEDA